MSNQVTQLVQDNASEIAIALSGVWQAIAYDIIQARAEMGHQNPESVPNAEALELVLDADRPETFLAQEHPFFTMYDGVCGKIDFYLEIMAQDIQII